MPQVTQDTSAESAQKTNPANAPQPGSGSEKAPSGGAAPHRTTYEETQGQQTYPGVSGDAGVTGGHETPVAGDKDPDSTQSADQTGQSGDLSQPDKRKAFPYDH